MDFLEAVGICFKKYGNPAGRARRAEFWYWILFVALVSIGTKILDEGLHIGWLNAISGLLLLVPTVMVTIRRLHDQGRGGWMTLLILIPFIGTLILLYFGAKPGTSGRNAFGPDPLAGNAGAREVPQTKRLEDQF